MVLAISHTRMTRERRRVVLESKTNSETIKNIADNIADNIAGNIAGNILYDKQQSCLEMFRLW